MSDRWWTLKEYNHDQDDFDEVRYDVMMTIERKILNAIMIF